MHLVEMLIVVAELAVQISGVAIIMCLARYNILLNYLQEYIQQAAAWSYTVQKKVMDFLTLLVTVPHN